MEKKDLEGWDLEKWTKDEAEHLKLHKGAIDATCPICWDNFRWLLCYFSYLRAVTKLSSHLTRQNPRPTHARTTICINGCKRANVHNPEDCPFNHCEWEDSSDNWPAEKNATL